MKGEYSEKPISTDEIENVLVHLPGVTSARVVSDAGGAIAEIHLLATSDRNPREIVRDVETLLETRWRIKVDHRKVSVAQMAGQSRPKEQRLKLHSVRVEIQQGTLSARVELSLEKGLYVGEATGPFSQANRRRVVAQATLQAVAEYLENRAEFQIADVGRQESGLAPLVVVVVEVSHPGGDETLVGAGYVRRDEAEAIARATLDALNRRIPRLALARTGTL